MPVPRLMLLVTLLLAPAAGAQEEMNLFLDAVDVNVVNVEVMVTDGDGEPVHGLTAAEGPSAGETRGPAYRGPACR